MKITVIGGGPGGLYFSILTKKAMPDCQIDVYERNKPDDSFGFGVVFSDETLGEFLKRDMQSYELIRSKFAYWDDIIIARDGQEVGIAGNGFCGCSRKTLLQLLHQRCQEEGVNLHFEANIEDVSQFSDSDVIVACDGISSQIRTQFENDFGTKVELKKNKFVWMGSTKPLDAFTYFFKETKHGSFAAHTYQYEKGMSTWIFECAPETWEKFGFDTYNEEDTVQKLKELFKTELDGHSLITNKSHWRQFPHVTNENWFKDNIVLLGDSKATAHYSIGSGTKLAMECAIALSDAIVANPTTIQIAFQNYENSRRNIVEMIQYAANVSLDWFENMDRHIQHSFYQFAFGCMTRSKKVTYENLRLRDKLFTDKVLEEFNGKIFSSSALPEALEGKSAFKNTMASSALSEVPEGKDSAKKTLASSASASSLAHSTLPEALEGKDLTKNTLASSASANSPSFSKFKLRNLELQNRIVMAPMGQYMAKNGLINDWHFQHYTSRAVGGLGLILTEMTAVSEKGRITEGCAGIYNQNQIEAWERINDFIHQYTSTKIGVQLGHSGRKGASKKPWETTFTGNNWELLSASSLVFNENCTVPKEMTSEDMDLVVSQFVHATKNAEKANFDMIELQAHHGFLLASFLSPLTNIRKDEFGGSIENRLKFPLRVFTEMRNVFPKEKPMSVRISATDWATNGISEKDVLTIATAFKTAGADIIDVSTGNTVANQKPQIGRMWQTSFSDLIRNTIPIPTITAGYIQDIDQINTIILNGRADLVALGKPLLLDANFVRNAQAYEQFQPSDIPNSYKMGISHLYPLKASERKQTEGMRKALKPKSNKTK